MPRHTIIESLMNIGGRRSADGDFGQTVAPATDLTRPPQPGRPAAAAPVRGPFVLLARLSGAQVHDALRGLEAAESCRQSLLALELALASEGGLIVQRAEHEVAGLFESLEAALAAACRMLRAPGAQGPDTVTSPVHVAVDEPAGFGRRELDECLEGLAGLSLLAWPGQIVVGPGAYTALPEAWRSLCRDRGVARIRGRNLPFQEILWRDTAAPVPPAAPASGPMPPLLRLCLRQGERTCFIGPDAPAARIGRATDATIVLTDGRCSREHARIEWRNGHFALRDQSLNGTFVAFRGRGPFLLKHDETVLYGAGRFFCGHDGSKEPQTGIDFELVSD